MLRRSLALVFALSLLASACAASKSDDACSVGADCASGACGADGRCAPVTQVDAGHDAAPADGAPSDAADDARSDAAPDARADVGTTGCTPNGDHMIEPAELPLGPGLKATYRVATKATVSTAGTAQPDGTRRWDFSTPLAGDKDVLVNTLTPTGAWWTNHNWRAMQNFLRMSS